MTPHVHAARMTRLRAKIAQGGTEVSPGRARRGGTEAHGRRRSDCSRRASFRSNRFSGFVSTSIAHTSCIIRRRVSPSCSPTCARFRDHLRSDQSRYDDLLRDATRTLVVTASAVSSARLSRTRAAPFVAESHPPADQPVHDSEVTHGATKIATTTSFVLAALAVASTHSSQDTSAYPIPHRAPRVDWRG